MNFIMTHDTFQPLEQRTLRNNVTDRIRRAILDGTLAPGAQVNQLLIAEQMGVSRGPVREALGQLEEEGLIRNVPYKGTFVNEVTLTFIEELYSIRRLLEVFAIRRATERSDAEMQQACRKIVDEMHEAADANDTDRLRELDLRFHALICLNAQHGFLMQMWKSIETGVRRCLAMRHSIYDDPHDIIGSHPDILAAMEAHDAERAGQLLDTHIKEAGELLARAWSKALAKARVDDTNGEISSQSV